MKVARMWATRAGRWRSTMWAIQVSYGDGHGSFLSPSLDRAVDDIITGRLSGQGVDKVILEVAK